MELGVDLDIGQYVASGVVAFDLHRRTIKWSQVRGDEAPWGLAGRRRNAACGVGSGWCDRQLPPLRWLPPCPQIVCLPSVFEQHQISLQHLDLSTDYTSFKAYAYSPPTLADIDGDGKLEVILGTSMVSRAALHGSQARQCCRAAAQGRVHQHALLGAPHRSEAGHPSGRQATRPSPPAP